MYRVAILKKDGTNESKNFLTKELGEDWILEQGEKGIKKAFMTNLENKNEKKVFTF